MAACEGARAIVVLLAALIGSGVGAVAQTAEPLCVADREPNDHPENGMAVAGPFCVDGSFADGDQDIFLWTVTASDTTHGWTIDLDGLAGQQTKFQIHHLDEPARGGAPALVGPELLALATPPGETHVVGDDVLVAPGTYVIGLSVSGGVGRYRLRLASAPPLDTLTRESAAVTGAFAGRGDLASGETELRWNLDDAAAGQRWALVASAPLGLRPTLRLVDPRGSVVVNATGDPSGAVAVPDLGLDTGAWKIRIASPAPGPFVIRASAAGPRGTGREEEPNDDVAHARPIALGRAMAGRLAVEGDVDCFGFAVSPSLAEKRLEAVLDAPGRSFRRLCLVDAKGAELSCRAGLAPRLSDLGLAAGAYAFCASGTRDVKNGYTLAVNLAGRRLPDVESEPNDSAALANALPQNGASQRIHGRWVGVEADAFRLDVSGEPRLWKVSLSAPAEMRVLDGRGATEAARKAAPGETQTEITDLFLSPGPHVIVVEGENASYDLAVEATGVPDPMAEREPNDRPSQAQRIRFGETRTGVLTQGDRDSYRFSLAAEEHVAIRIEPSAAADLRFTLEWSAPAVERPTAPSRGEPLVYDALLPPGEYGVTLVGADSSEVDYRIALERRDPFAVTVDQEPNDLPGQARPVPPNLTVSGTVGEWKDPDFFELPRLAAASKLTARATGDVRLALVADGDDLPSDTSGGALTASIPAERAVELAVRGDGPYTVALRFDPGPAPVAEADSSGLRASLALDAPAAVAAHWVRAQTLGGTLTLVNGTVRPLDLTLASTASQPALHPTLARTAVRLAPNATERVPVAIEIEPDALVDETAQIAVRAATADGARRSAVAKLAVTADAASVADHRFAPLPPELLGGWNLAWAALGSTVVAGERDDDGSTRQQAWLFDELTSTPGFARAASALPFDTTVAFAGDRAWPVAGVILNAETQGGLTSAERLRDFEVWLAEDGRHFERVLASTLSSRSGEQAFVLDRPRLARAARLRWLSNQARARGEVGPAALGLGEWKVGLGEWKVVAPPGEPAGVSLDIAERSRGGHVVAATPTLGRAPDVAESLFEAGGHPAVVELDANARPELVIGFHEDRAARLAALEWVESTDGSTDLRFTAFDVSVSTESPLGPWKNAGAFVLDRDAKGVATFRFAAPEWARFVKLAARAPVGKKGTYRYPVALRVLESASDGVYRSILGEWGHLGREAIAEALAAPIPKAVALAPGEATSRERARELALGEAVAGEALVGERDGWYRVAIPAGANTLTLRLTGTPTVDVDARIENADGKALALRASWAGPTLTALEADVEAGERYWIHVAEPERSVAIAYDTSLSLAGYTDVILRGLQSFASGVKPGIEAVNFLPFGRPFLMDAWSDQPFALLAALAKADTENPSSDLEATVTEASRALGERGGSRALLVLTDAATTGYLEQEAAWATVGAVRPRVFASHIGADADPLREKQLLQDLAAVNGGCYVSARSQAEMDTSFERVAAWLRRPARYQLVAEARRAAPPEPGTIVVRSARVSAATSESAMADDARGGAIELILDASGSMLSRLEGKRRIEIARTVLGDLATRELPRGTPLALRVFGDDRPGSCETRLAVPLAPLDAPALVKRIAAIQPQNLARTPIAAALAQVAVDLKDAHGPRTVVLVTDGEETCGGDPRAEIQALAGASVDVRVDIVGFAVVEAQIAKTFAEWAREGRGRYFAAANARELEAAVRTAVKVPFRVLAENGTEVASGAVDGERVTVPAGRYRVEVGTAGSGGGAPPSGAVFESVVVEPKQSTELTLPTASGG